VKTVCIAVCLGLCLGSSWAVAADAPALTVVAECDRQWTGLAVVGDDVFVCFPRWSPDVPVSVARLIDGEAAPWPDAAWNDWSPGQPVEGRFVCVQSVVGGGDGSLWVLDPGNAFFMGVVPGAARLLRFDAATGELRAIFVFDEPAITAASYLNDVRVDAARGFAYLTDSGTGALVVLDLASGASRRLLADHPATKAEGVVLTVEGRQWRLPDGSVPQVHADGIALSPDGDTLYFQALCGRTLHAVPTTALRDTALAAAELAERLRVVGETGASDGLICDARGFVYVTALEHNAIRRVNPGGGVVETLVAGPEIRWPDSFAWDESGRLLFTTSQIHLWGQGETPYLVLRVEAPSR
jgi:sugar lactone lactonase YvrE